MPKKVVMALGAGLAAALVGTSTQAQDCLVEAPDAYEMTEEQIVALYACIEAAMPEAYAKEGNAIGAAYRSWTVTGTRPGPDPSHGDRLLLTFANEIAAPEYLKFAAEGVEIPVGGILAKESIAIREGKGRVGPLFIMEKVGVDAAPETDGWRYSAVQPNGKPMGVQQGFCHGCHGAFADQDSLAYPAEELRVRP